MDQGLKGKGKRKGEYQGGEGGGEERGGGGKGGGEEEGISGVGGVWSRGNQKPHDNLTKKIKKKISFEEEEILIINRPSWSHQSLFFSYLIEQLPNLWTQRLEN